MALPSPEKPSLILMTTPLRVFADQGIDVNNQKIEANIIEIVKSEFGFDDMMEWYETPFPCNEFCFEG